MGVMRGYLCERCPLAFEIGGYAFWELDGRREQAVCRACPLCGGPMPFLYDSTVN